jgi:hypothetical protein
MLSINSSYGELLKRLYFADTTERGDRGRKEAQRQGEDRVTLNIMVQDTTPAISSVSNVPHVPLSKTWAAQQAHPLKAFVRFNCAGRFPLSFSKHGFI